METGAEHRDLLLAVKLQVLSLDLNPGSLHAWLFCYSEG